MSDTLMLIVAGYQDPDLAQREFDAVVERIQAKQVRCEGMILVGKDADGQVTVADTGDHLGRKGAGWGGGVGVLVGLFAPPLLASVAVGAAAGGVVGKFAGHKVRSAIEEQVTSALTPGSAVVIGVYPAEYRLAVEQALAGAPMKSVVESDKSGIYELKRALAEAMGKFEPDRTVLPLRDKPFGGVAGRTQDGSVPDWSIVAGPKAPDGAPNVLLVLIDDAGFGGPDTFGGQIRTPNLTRVQQMGLTYNRFHVTAVCSPTRAALLTGRNHHRVGFGSIAEYPGPVPRVLRRPAAELHGAAAHPARQRLRDGRLRQVAPHPGQRPGRGGPVRPLADVVGIRPLVGVPVRCRRAVRPDHHPGQQHRRRARGQRRQALLLPGRPHRPVDPVAARRPCAGRPQAVVPLLLHRGHARPAPCAAGVGRPLQGPVRRGLGRLPREDPRAAEATRHRPAGHRAHRAPRTCSPPGTSLSDAERKLYARQMEVFAGFSENADWNVGRLLDDIEAMGELDNTLILYIWGDNGASMEGTLTGSFNETTFLNGVVLDAEHQLALIEEYGGIAGLGGEMSAPHFAVGLGAREQHPVPVGQADGQPSRRRPQPDGGGLAGAHLTGHAPCATSSRTPSTSARPCCRPSASPSRPASTASRRSRWTAPRSSTLSMTRRRPSSTRRSTSRCSAAAPCTRTAGGRAPGWTRPPGTSRRRPSRGSPPGLRPGQDVWELYYLPDDFSQAKDLAAEHPEKLAELQELFWVEAERNRALPLLGGLSIFFGILPPLPTVTRLHFAGDVQNIQRGMVPRIYGRSYAIEADLVVPEGGAEGVIVANADFFGGFAVWVDGDGLLRHTYSFLGVETYRQKADQPLPTGDVTVKMLFTSDEAKAGQRWEVTLFVERRAGGRRTGCPAPCRLRSRRTPGMDVGRDNGLVVDREYEDKAPYAFTGTVKGVVFDLHPNHHEASSRSTRRPPRAMSPTARPADRQHVRARRDEGEDSVTETDATAVDELGPVDYLIVEFPVGTQNFTGEMADELLRLAESGIIRVLDVLILQKGVDGLVEAHELDEIDGFDEIRALEANIAEILAADDVLMLAEAMEPGSVAVALVWENVWAAPFASAARRAGGQLVATGRIPIQAIVASIEAEVAAEAADEEGN